MLVRNDNLGCNNIGIIDPNDRGNVKIFMLVLRMAITGKPQLVEIISKQVIMTYLCWNNKGNVKIFMLVLRMAITGKLTVHWVKSVFKRGFLI